MEVELDDPKREVIIGFDEAVNDEICELEVAMIEAVLDRKEKPEEPTETEDPSKMVPDEVLKVRLKSVLAETFAQLPDALLKDDAIAGFGFTKEL